MARIFCSIWLLSRLCILAFNPDTELCRALYFISNDLFIGYLIYKLRGIDITLMSAALGYCAGALIVDILLFCGLGDVMSWFYNTIIVITTIIGYIYGRATNNEL